MIGGGGHSRRGREAAPAQGDGRRGFSLRTKLIGVLLVVCIGFGVAVRYAILSSAQAKMLQEAKERLALAADWHQERLDEAFRKKEALGIAANKLATAMLFTPDQQREERFAYSRDEGGSLRSLSPDGVSGAFVSNKTALTPAITGYLAATEKMWSTLGPVLTTGFFNLYIITKDNALRISPPQWSQDVEPDHDFSGDIFFYIADAEHNPKREPVWTPVYYDSIFKKWMISLIIPVYDGDEFFGITGSDYTLEGIFTESGINELYSGGLGKVFLFDRRGNILAHPDYMGEINAKQGAMNAEFSFREIKEAGLAAFLARPGVGERDDEGPTHYEEQGATTWICVKRLETRPWSLAAYETQEALTRGFTAINRQFVMTMGVTVVLLAGVLILVIRRTILSRLLALERSVQAFGRGESPEYPEAGNDELGNLIRAFQRTAEGRQRYRETLERDVAEKTKDLSENNKRLEREIAERSKIEESLRESEDRYRMLVEHIHVGIARVDADHTILMVNPALASLVQSTPEKLVGTKCFGSFEHKEGVCEYCPATAAMTDGRVHEVEFLQTRPDGSRLFVRLQAVPTYGPDGRLTGFIELVEDITNRKRAESALAKSEERLRRALENIPDVVVLYDRDLRIQLVNAATTQLTGRPTSEYLGRRDNDVWPPEVCEVYLPSLREAIRTRETQSLEADLELPGVGRRRLLITCVPVADQDGEVQEVLGITHDLTDRRRAEEALQKARSDLENRVEQRTLELAKANERLQEEMAGRLKSAARMAWLNALRAHLIERASISEKLKSITDGIVDIFDADFARVWLIRPGDLCARGCMHANIKEGAHVCRERIRCLHLMASSGRYTHLDGEEHRRVPYGCYKIGRIALGEEKKFLTNEVTTDPRVHNHEWAKALGLAAFAGYRLTSSDGQAIGVVALFSRQAISPEEDALLEGLAHTTEQVIENCLAEARISEFTESLEKRVNERTSQLDSVNSALWEEIADRRQIEEALSEREATLRAITTSAQDAIIMMNPEGNVSFWNEAAQRILGYTEQEAIGQNVHNFLGPERYLDAHRRAYAHFQRTGEGAAVGKTLELAAIRKDKTEIPVELSLSAIQLHDKWHAVAIMRDITERKRVEAELAAMQQRLVSSSRQAGMAEVATSVLHNVGNVLNSVNVSASVAADQLRGSKVPYVAKVAELLQEHCDNLGDFVANSEKGKKLPAYVGQLAEHLQREQNSVMEELHSLVRKVDHIKEIVAQQQTLAGKTSLVEDIDLVQVVDEALHLCGLTGEQAGMKLAREYSERPRLRTDRHKVLQILVNLLRNAKDALKEKGASDSLLTVRVESAGESGFSIIVSDNGVGIAAENLTRVFTHGFTTKPHGHGFGLHGSALLAKELGGKLHAASAGVGSGADFTLELPAQSIEVGT